MADLQEYKCPRCGGAIEFNSQVQKMKCPYCDTVFEMDTLKKLDGILKTDSKESMEWDSGSHKEWNASETAGMREYVCKSCGGSIIGDENMAATSCPYCGNPVVVMGQFQGSLKPDYVIPFKYDKKAAKEALKKHYEGKRLLPKVFKQENHIDEVQGIYVPFWLFDADVEGSFRYHATKVREWSDDKYDYKETKHFTVIREGDIGFDHIPVDGSSKMDNTLMESLEPFDFSGIEDFQTAYLAGYLADKYDVSEQDSEEIANERIRNSTAQEFYKTVKGFDTVKQDYCSMNLTHGKAKYALYPVWILNTSWKGQNYTFAMNGQTGKLVGNLPMDKGAFWRYFLAITTGVAVIVTLAIHFLA